MPLVMVGHNKNDQVSKWSIPSAEQYSGHHSTTRAATSEGAASICQQQRTACLNQLSSFIGINNAVIIKCARYISYFNEDEIICTTGG